MSRDILVRVGEDDKPVGYPTPAIDKLAKLTAINPSQDLLIIHSASEKRGQMEKGILVRDLLQARNIVQSAGLRFVSDSEKVAWNNKADEGFWEIDMSGGMMPSDTAIVDREWELDGNDDIMPRGV